MFYIALQAPESQGSIGAAQPADGEELYKCWDTSKQKSDDQFVCPVYAIMCECPDLQKIHACSHTEAATK